MKGNVKIGIVCNESPAKNYVNALQSLGTEAFCAATAKELGDCAGLILPGGGDMVPQLYGEENHGSIGMDGETDLRQLESADFFVVKKRPVLGICKGMQLLNVYLGGTLHQDLETADSHVCVGGRDQAHDTVIEEGSFLYGIYGDRAVVNSAHHQAVKAVGRGLKIVQKAYDGVFEAMEHETLPIVAVQWHPERMCFAHRRADTVDGSSLMAHFVRLVRERG